jgi:PII-like signaling protein
MQDGIYLKLYVPEQLRVHSDLFYEWIMNQAKAIGISGGSACRSIAAYGRHGHLQEQHFFELARELPIILEFFATNNAVDELLALLATQKHSVFYIKSPAQAGQTISD